MSDVQWTLWVFAGPGAFSGLIQDGRDLTHQSASPGDPPPLGPVLARVLEPGFVMPAGSRLLAEVTGAPTLLQELTDQWPSARLVLEAGQALAEPERMLVPSDPADPGMRDLRSFLEWAESKTPPDCKRALVLLGDVSRAIGDLEAPAGALGPGRPTYPSRVVIRKDSNAPTEYMWTSSGWLGGSSGPMTSEQLYAKAREVEQVPDNVTGHVPTLSERDPWLDALLLLKAYTGVSDADTANRSLEPDAPRRDGGNARRIDALVTALATRRSQGRTSLAIDLIASDDQDLTQLLALRRLAPHAQVIFGSPLPQPIAGRLLADLLEVLALSPALEPEALATEAIDRGHQRASRLMQRSKALLAKQPDGETPRLAAARALVGGGSESIAIRSTGIPTIVAALDALADQALALLDRDSAYGPLLRRGLVAGTGDLGRLTESMFAIDERYDSLRERAKALEQAVADATVAHRELHREGSARTPTLGLALGDIEHGEGSSWRNLLDAVAVDVRSEVERRAQADLEAFAVRSRSTSRRARPRGRTVPFVWIEIGATDRDIDLDQLLAKALDEHPARHVGLVVRGKARMVGGKPGGASVVLASSESLSISTLARSLREALSHRHREPLAIVVLDDPALLGLEIAYELREVAHVLATGTDASSPIPFAALDCLTRELVAQHEADVARVLERPADGSSTPLAAVWHRDVAKRLADELAARVNASGSSLVGVDLRFIEALCRRFDRVCQIMLDSLGEGVVMAALEAGFREESLIGLINLAQMQQDPPGIWFYAAKQPHWTWLADALYKTMDTVYEWVCWPRRPAGRDRAPLWIGAEPPEHVDGRIHGRYLRITTAAGQPADYRELAFHQDVRLHALLTAWQLIRGSGASNPSALWGLASLGIAFAPAAARRQYLEHATDGGDAAHYFTAFGPPPLMRLDIEVNASGSGYELRLGSDESAAVLVRHHSTVDLATVDRSLDGLSHAIAHGSTTSDGWSYLESLGASLAEDVINELHEQIERERAALLGTERSRDAHLALALPRELMRYPWELMRLPPRAPGQPHELLAERFAVGRQMWSDRAVRRIRRDDPIRLLVIGDPRRPSGAPLEGARTEAEQIVSLCETLVDELAGELDFERERDAFIGTTMTRAALRRLVREGSYDVLHFAGHGTYDSRRPEQSGWLLSDGMLTVTELRNTLAWTESPPWLIFANACNSAMTDGRAASAYQGELYGMAESCIRVGVNAYIGPLWKVLDESACLLATELYRNLLLKRSTIGAALRLARVRVRTTWEQRRGSAGIGDVSWAGMVLFGNPTERINETAGS